MAMPVNAHHTKRILSCFSIFTTIGFNKNNNQSNSTVTPTLTTFNPNGFASCKLVRCFAALKFIAKNKLVKSKAKWPVVVLFKTGVLIK
jgi:hypothetical protein